MNWHPIKTAEDVYAIEQRSHDVPCLIFKHSTSCPISGLAKMRLEGDWDFPADKLETYYLDLLAHRDVSHLIADHFSVHHESPQVLLIRDGQCTYDNSHLDISVSEIHECYDAVA